MKKQNVVLGMTIVTATLFFSGCGPSLGEKIMEKTIETQTGGKVDINADKGEMTIKTEQGDISVSGEGTATLNKDFPQDIYLAPDAQIIMSLANGQDRSYSVAYTTAMKIEEIYPKYKEELTAKGWSPDAQTEMTFGESKTLLFEKGTQRLTLIVGTSQDEQSAGRTHVQIIGAEDKVVN